MRRATALILLLATSSCYMHSVEIRPWRDEPYASATNMHYFWGITGATTPAAVCQRGLERATFYMPWWGFFLSVVTIGIVVPTTVDYVCDSRSQYENATPGRDPTFRGRPPVTVQPGEPPVDLEVIPGASPPGPPPPPPPTYQQYQGQQPYQGQPYQGQPYQGQPYPGQ